MKLWRSFRSVVFSAVALALCVSTSVRGELQVLSPLTQLNCSGEKWNTNCNVRRAQSTLDELSESVIVEVNLTASETKIVSPPDFGLTMGSYIQLSIKDNVNVLSTRVRILKEENLGLRTGGNYLIQLFLRINFQYISPASGEVFDITQWVKEAFDTAEERTSFVALLRERNNGDIQQLQGMKLELDTFSVPTTASKSFGVGAIIGVLGGIFVGILLGCLAYFFFCRKTEKKTVAKIADAQSTDSTNRMEIVINNTGGDDISTLGDPYCGATTVSKLDERTTASSLAYDYSKNITNNNQDQEEAPAQDCYTEATAHTKMSIGMTGSLLADDQSFDQQYDDDETLDFEKFLRDGVTDEKDKEVIKVMVPPGKLGIVLDDKAGSGPVIHAIKSNSPLFGRVQVGDFIINLNDERISHMAAYEISRLISEKSDEDRILEFHRQKELQVQ